MLFPHRYELLGHILSPSIQVLHRFTQSRERKIEAGFPQTCLWTMAFSIFKQSVALLQICYISLS